jgi:hypothetical protein
MCHAATVLVALVQLLVCALYMMAAMVMVVLVELILLVRDVACNDSNGSASIGLSVLIYLRSVQ